LKKAVWRPSTCVFLGDFEGRSPQKRLVQQAARPGMIRAGIL
jgi:hypothetical protein